MTVFKPNRNQGNMPFERDGSLTATFIPMNTVLEACNMKKGALDAAFEKSLEKDKYVHVAWCSPEPGYALPEEAVKKPLAEEFRLRSEKSGIKVSETENFRRILSSNSEAVKNLRSKMNAAYDVVGFVLDAALDLNRKEGYEASSKAATSESFLAAVRIAARKNKTSGDKTKKDMLGLAEQLAICMNSMETAEDGVRILVSSGESFLTGERYFSFSSAHETYKNEWNVKTVTAYASGKGYIVASYEGKEKDGKEISSETVSPFYADENFKFSIADVVPKSLMDKFEERNLTAPRIEEPEISSPEPSLSVTEEEIQL